MIPFNGQTWRVTGTSPATADFVGRIAGKADTTGSTPVQAAASLLKAMPQVSSK
jgi:hypothetical protein